MGRHSSPEIDRFNKFIKINAFPDCWLWSGHLDKDGYGTFWSGKQSQIRAHRWSYEYHKEKIPDGLTVDHLCRIKNCVNPDHLEIVTNTENIKRAKDAITHCKNGHELSGRNLYIRPDGDRGCRVCRLAADKRYLARKAEKLRIVRGEGEKS